MVRGTGGVGEGAETRELTDAPPHSRTLQEMVTEALQENDIRGALPSTARDGASSVGVVASS